MRIDLEGLDETIRRLENYKGSISYKMHQVIEKLGKIGINVASAEFTTAQYDGLNDVTVSGEWIAYNIYAVVAQGQAVAFIEFGSGVTYKGDHPLRENVPGLSPIGTYGKGHGSREFWEYYGDPGTNGEVKASRGSGAVVKTRGNPPARAMYKADVEMRTIVHEIVKEVFDGDRY